MEWLNYHHLFYFWLAAREGGVSRAADQLRLAQPTLSAQIRSLEGMLGEKLFRRRGRTLVPTEVGRVVYQYADDIFALGRELLDTVRARTKSAEPCTQRAIRVDSCRSARRCLGCPRSRKGCARRSRTIRGSTT
jgi:LysR family transcriptional activator of nhaA